MAGAPLLLGIDVGTSRTKAVLVDGTGVVVASAAQPTPFASTAAGVEAPVPDVLAAVAAATADLGPDPRRVAAVAIAGLAESGAPLDDDERPLAPVIAWHDRRGAETVELLERTFGEGLAARLGQPLRTVSSVAKLGWLATNGVVGIRWWLGVPELCLHRLTGARATDFSLAARTGAYDVGERCSMPEVLEALGLPVDVFPEPAPAGSVMGEVSRSGAAWSGLPSGIPVTVAGHDHLAGVVGSGAAPGDLVNSVGTAETVVGQPDTLPDLTRALALRAAVTLTPRGHGWAVLASGARAGLVLDAAERALGQSAEELDALADGVRSMDAAAYVAALEANAGGAQPPSADLPPGSPGEVWNGVLQVLASRTWDAARRVEELSGPARRLVVFGGGSRSEPWLRAKAEQATIPVLRSTAAEAVARGAAVFAGVAAGWWTSTDDAPRPRLEPV